MWSKLNDENDFGKRKSDKQQKGALLAGNKHDYSMKKKRGQFDIKSNKNLSGYKELLLCLVCFNLTGYDHFMCKNKALAKQYFPVFANFQKRGLMNTKHSIFLF